MFRLVTAQALGSPENANHCDDEDHEVSQNDDPHGNGKGIVEGIQRHPTTKVKDNGRSEQFVIRFIVQ